MNQRRGQILAILSLVAAAGLPLLFVLMRLRVFTFRDDFTGFNALGFALSWALALLVSGALLGGLAWHADRRSWLARSALLVNGVLLTGLLWLLLTLGW
jgi:asparagine N-glycosylation enzyme membrane subunit Stt3